MSTSCDLTCQGNCFYCCYGPSNPLNADATPSKTVFPQSLVSIAKPSIWESGYVTPGWIDAFQKKGREIYAPDEIKQPNTSNDKVERAKNTVLPSIIFTSNADWWDLDYKILQLGPQAITSLNLSRSSELTVNSFRKIAICKNLTALQLPSHINDQYITNLVAAFLEQPSDCKLQTLSLAGCQGITDASVSALKKLTSLCDLDLSYTNITDAAVAALSPFIPKFNASGNYHVTPQEVSKIRSGLSTTNCGRMVLRHVNGEPRTSISEDSERYVGMVLYRTQEIFQGYGNRTYVKEDFPDQAFTRENDYIDDGRPHSEYPVKPY